jgi:acetamidase/formamidase
VYLPVNVPGALLCVRDGHAARGDGELNGNALETSMDIEFTVDIFPAKRIIDPRVESATHIWGEPRRESRLRNVSGEKQQTFAPGFGGGRTDEREH